MTPRRRTPWRVLPRAHRRLAALLVLALAIALPIPAVSAAGSDVPELSVQVHRQTYGWQAPVGSSETAGVPGSGKRVEALRVQASGVALVGRAHVQSIGWQPERALYEGASIGTTGRALRLEAIQLQVEPGSKPAALWSVEYRVWAVGLGWMAWERDGRTAGTTGQARRVEAVQVRLVPRSAPPPSTTPPTTTPPPASGQMAITFIRHGQSQSNLSDTIDTSVPGGGLTSLGQQQAQKVATAWASAGFDCIAASPYLRTQQTAAPLAKALGKTVKIVPVGEVPAGIYQGTPKAANSAKLLEAPAQWVAGNLEAARPGSEDGYAFYGRMVDAVKELAAAGCVRPVVFSHSLTIATYVSLATGSRNLPTGLNNTGYVQITGSLAAGWKLSKWSANPK